MGENKSQILKLEKLIGFRGKKKEDKSTNSKSTQVQPQANINRPATANNTPANPTAAEEGKNALEILKTGYLDQSELIKA